MKVLYINQVEALEVQATDKQGVYFVSIETLTKSINMDYEPASKVFSTMIVPAKKMQQLSKKAREMAAVSEDGAKEKADQWFIEQQLKHKIPDTYAIVVGSNKQPLSTLVNELIDGFTPSNIE